MTKKEQSLIDKNYGLDKKCKTEEEAISRKKQHHENGFFCQTIPRKENNQKYWFVYVKK